MIYLLLVSLIWAFSFGLIKTNLSSIDPVVVTGLRLLIAAVAFMPFLKLSKIGKKTIFNLAAIGSVQFGLMYVFYNISFQYLKAFEVALFTIFTPIYVALINNAIERKWYWFYILTSLTAIIGTAIIVQTSFDRPGMLTGFAVIQLSNICFAVGQVLYRKLMRLHSEVRDMDIFGLTYLGGFLTALIISPFFVDYGNITITPLQWGNLIYLGAFASGLGFFLWNYGARRTNIGALAIFNNFKIPLSITVSLLFFNEKADLSHLILGGAIVIASLGINELMEHRKMKKKLLLDG